MYDDTICAPATSPVNAPIAIIRMSGPGSLGAVQSLFSNAASIENRHARYGSIIDQGRAVDDVILVFYEGPGSYTGEDMVEIFCHGNQIIVHRILDLLFRQGIRMAEPGEFSRRAFLNGKMDLTEAEAINQVILARSEWEVEAALMQMHGSLRGAIAGIRDKCITLKADVEAGIDFIGEDIEFVSSEESLRIAGTILGDLEDVLLRCRLGEKVSRGFDVTIAGKPNVGKSSILNMLLNQERAIVSDIPGTTRDLIKETVQIEGLAVNLIDTAGINRSGDTIEKIGIELSHKNIATASIVVMVLDGTTGITDVDRDILREVSTKRTLYLINKIDLAPEDTVRPMETELMQPVIRFSAKTGEGLRTLEKAIAGILHHEFVDVSNTFIADVRVITLLEKAIVNIQQALLLVESKEPPEIIAFELQSLLENLGDITGEITPDDILGSIFNRFCIGK